MHFKIIHNDMPTTRVIQAIYFFPHDYNCVLLQSRKKNLH